MNREENSERREFLKKSLAFSGAALGAYLLGDIDRLYANTVAGGTPDLVAVKNGEPGPLFDKAIEAMGGMKKFVKPNQTVVVKPNIGWSRAPETGANTNPALVTRVIEHCRQAGAKKIYVFDHSVDTGKYCYKNSGIEDAAKAAGAVVVAGDDRKYYQEVDIPGGKSLKKAKVHELILDSDVYINIPVLKHHFASSLTMAMKNQMGIVYDRMAFHSNSLHRCIAELCQYKVPDLNILDAYRVTLRGGPQRARKEDLAMMKSLLISKDIVAIDAAGSKMFGKDPLKISHIFHADKAKIGNMNLDELNIKKIDLAG